MKGACKLRILSALRWKLMTERELANELFVCLADIKRLADELHEDGLVYRKRRHCNKAGRPIFFYSNIKFPPVYQRAESDDLAGLRTMIGEWDALQGSDMIRLSKGTP